jgi:hypothetical protein
MKLLFRIIYKIFFILTILAGCTTTQEINEDADFYSFQMPSLQKQCLDPNYRTSGAGTTDLMLEAAYGRTDTVQALLEQGADVNAKDNYGITALIFAEGMGHAEIIRMLKKAGAK